jgi:hypothetical protein
MRIHYICLSYQLMPSIVAFAAAFVTVLATAPAVAPCVLMQAARLAAAATQ